MQGPNQAAVFLHYALLYPCMSFIHVSKRYLVYALPANLHDLHDKFVSWLHDADSRATERKEFSQAHQFSICKARSILSHDKFVCAGLKETLETDSKMSPQEWWWNKSQDWRVQSEQCMVMGLVLMLLRRRCESLPTEWSSALEHVSALWPIIAIEHYK